MVCLFRCLIVAVWLYPALAAGVVSQEYAPTVADTTPEVAASVETGTNEASARVALEERVTAKWEALIRRDFAAAYAFTSPAYRATFPLDAFQRRFAGKVAWRRIEVVAVDFTDDDAAVVGIDLHFVYYHPQRDQATDMVTFIQESWVRVDGQWWYLIQK